LFHQVFCYLCANVFLIGWIHRLRDLRSVWTLEVFQDTGAPRRKLLNGCLVCETKTNCLSLYRFWQ
jgi:nitrate reductase gamma subunit